MRRAKSKAEWNSYLECLQERFSLPISDIKKYKLLWSRHRTYSKGRRDRQGNEIRFLLSFEEWLDIWLKSGKLDQRGSRLGQYHMCRKDDLGHYEVGNVEIREASEHYKERTSTQRKHPTFKSDEYRRKLSRSLRNSEKYRRAADAQRGKKKPRRKKARGSESRPYNAEVRRILSNYNNTSPKYFGVKGIGYTYVFMDTLEGFLF